MDGAYSKEDHKVVAIFSIGIYWNYVIRDVLPQGSTGILVVFESVCAQSFTYEVNGPDVVYLGAGEYHDPNYDHIIPVDNQRLYFMNWKLVDGKLISHFKVRHKSTLDLRGMTIYVSPTGNIPRIGDEEYDLVKDIIQ